MHGRAWAAGSRGPFLLCIASFGRWCYDACRCEAPGSRGNDGAAVYEGVYKGKGRGAMRFLGWSMVPVVVIVTSASPAAATNGHQLSAIGAYQQGMAGAVTAAPYDATTAIANPAGMAMIGSRTDFSFELFAPDREVSFEGGGRTSGGSGSYLVPAIGWTAPVSSRGDWYFGGGMYGVSGMGVDYDAVSAPFMAGMLGWNPGSSVAHLWSQYQFWKMAPTIAWKGRTLAVGVAVNLDYQAIGFKQVYTGTAGGADVRYGMDLSEMQGAMGYGATVGLIYSPAPSFSIGINYASKQDFSEFKWRLAAGDIDLQAAGGPVNAEGTFTMDLDFPQQASIGIAVRPVRRLLWTADAKWVNFSDTYDSVTVSGGFSGGLREIELDFGWDDVAVYATALQLEITPNLVVRAGYNHSNAPIDRNDAGEVENNLIFPAIVESRAAAGFTYRFGSSWELTMACLKAAREEMKGESGTVISLEETAVDVEVSYRF